MARQGLDIHQVQRMADRFQRAIRERVVERYLQEVIEELARETLDKIKARTPSSSGQLRGKWEIGNIQRKGNKYEVEIFNNTAYASDIEYGYMGVLDWVGGRFMMTISMQELERKLPSYLHKKNYELIEQILNGRPSS